jgi:hypothetical protein
MVDPLHVDDPAVGQGELSADPAVLGQEQWQVEVGVL